MNTNDGGVGILNTLWFRSSGSHELRAGYRRMDNVDGRLENEMNLDVFDGKKKTVLDQLPAFDDN